MGERGLLHELGRRLEPGHALHGVGSQAVVDRVRAPVRAGQRLDAGRRADGAGQQVRVPALAPRDRDPARRRRPESGDRCGSDLDAVANYSALSVLCRQHGLHRGEHARARCRCSSARTTCRSRFSGRASRRMPTSHVRSRASGSSPNTRASSREYGGIHYHFDTTASQEVCPKVAGYIFGNYMRPKR